MKTLGTILLWVFIAWVAVGFVVKLFRQIGAWLSGEASFSHDIARGGKHMAEQAAQRQRRKRR